MSCSICGAETSAFQHDHRDDFSGIDDGPYREKAPDRRRSENNDKAAISAIRRAAWQTRREKYGRFGHR